MDIVSVNIKHRFVFAPAFIAESFPLMTVPAGKVTTLNIHA